MISSFLQLRREGLIDDAELLRLSYKFAGEVVDVEEILKAGKVAGPLASVAEAAMIAAAAAAVEREGAKKREGTKGEEVKAVTGD